MFEKRFIVSDRDRHGVRLNGADVAGFGSPGVFLLCLLQQRGIVDERNGGVRQSLSGAKDRLVRKGRFPAGDDPAHPRATRR